ncbi:unnamed protein product [Candida verbasci]|uniref:VASt domain-containing protein n=1 Tax=Candida verbasci TaxID=1227364 RepID=A0A9W4XFH1_9ASCO|nr:unnamed protein product [Candida verbasci]
MGLIHKKKEPSIDSKNSNKTATNSSVSSHHNHNYQDRHKANNRLSFHIFNKDKDITRSSSLNSISSTNQFDPSMQSIPHDHSKLSRNSLENRIDTVNVLNNQNVSSPQVEPGISIQIMKNTTRQDSNNDLLTIPQNKHDSKSTSTNSSSKQPQELNPEAIQRQNTSTDKNEASGSGGFLSSLITAAANKMSQPATSSTKDKDKDKDKDHTFAHKLDNLIKSVRHEESETSLNGDASPQVIESRNSQDKSLNSAHDVQFESIRESPLNTLGNGDLSLNDFENHQNFQQQQQQQQQQLLSSKQPSIRSNDEFETYSTKRTLSPDIIQQKIPLNNQLQATSNGTDVKRVHRRSINGDSINNRGNSIGGNSQIDTSTVISQDNDHHSSIKNLSEIKSRSTESDLISENSENENLDQIIDYSKKIKHASKKSNKEFHQAFKKLPNNEKLIDDFSCALSKDILVQGKMYLSDHYICFNSNILGWVTNIMIPLSEVIQIEKKSTAVLFPNGMIIRTLHQKYVFATFISRDTTFDLITNVWHRVLLENSDIDPSKLQQVAQQRRARANSKNSITSDSDYSSDDEMNSDGEENEEDETSEKEQDEMDNDDDEGEKDANEEKDGDSFNGFPIIGPKTHAPTESGYTKESGETVVAEDTIKAPPGVVYYIMFGSDISNFIKILKDQKNFDILESDIKGLDEKNKQRNYTYTKPLGGPIGPKQTKCVIEDKLVTYQPDAHYQIDQLTSTPDVPSGNAFKVHTKIFLSWGEKNSTKFYVVTSIEWSGKSWIKGAIEKGTIDGQKDSMKQMIETVNNLIESGNKKGGARKKSTRSRRNTEKKEEEEIEKPKTPEPELSKDPISQFINFVNSIGDLIPIPMLSNTITGSITLITSFLIFMFFFNNLFFSHGHQPSLYEIIPNNSYTSRIRIKNDEFLVIPSINTNLNNQRMIRQQEVSLWNWLKERSEGKLNLEFTGNLGEEFDGLNDEELKQKYSQQELKEIVKLTRIKLDKLSERLEQSEKFNN